LPFWQNRFASSALTGMDRTPQSRVAIAASFLVPVLAHIAVAAPTGRVTGTPRRTAVAAAYGLTTLFSVGYAITWDPFRDRQCWSDCTDNAFLLAGNPAGARLIEEARLATVVAVGVFTLIAVTWQFATATAIARAVGWPIALPAALASTSEAVYAAARLGDRAEGPERDLFVGVFLARAACLTALAAGVIWFLWQRRRRRAAFVTLVDALGKLPGTGSLQATLSRLLGDPSLTVSYWLPRVERYVDRSGRQVHPRAEPGRALTSIVRDGVPLAIVAHERDVIDDRTLRLKIGSAALLAIDNERLSAELLAHLEDLRASQRRIITAADTARRSIERDLHDGAQQRLLVVLYELRLARADPAVHGEEAAALDRLIGAAQQSLVDLRELAHGIFPTILEESGLEAALWTLADQASTVIQIDAMPDRRLPAAIEQAAYLVVTETLATAPSAGLTVHASAPGDVLVLQLDGPQAAPTQYLLDRIGAADGTLTYHDGTLHAEVPCG
jgi:signal transduction histidine kinase